MTKVELPNRRTAYSKHMYDPATGKVGATFVTGDPIHYKDANDVYQPIDMTPVRVQNASVDGWRVTQSGFHYFIGKDVVKDEDGWVGFGGQNGARWFNFRLHSAGYYYPPDQSWDVLQQTNYDRSNLKRTTGSVTVDGVKINTVTGAEWGSVLPGVDLYWRISGKNLKEFIRVSRDSFNNLPVPATPINGTFFGFVFELDAINIPRWVIKGIVQSINNGIEDTSGEIELHDDTDDLIAFLPIDFAFSSSQLEEREDVQRQTVRLRKRIYTNNGRAWLLIGAPITELQTLPKGDIVFDPTLETQPDETAAIDTWNEDPKFDNRGETNFGTSDGWHAQGPMHSAPRNAYIKWDLTSIPSGAVATLAQMTITNYYNGAGSGDMYLHPMLFAWEELELTWMQYKSGYPWPGSNGGETPNVDYDGDTVLAHFTGPSSAYQQMTFSITNLSYLQSQFGSTPTNPNYGWVLQAYSGLNNMYSSNASTATRRPKLYIEYEDVQPPPMSFIGKTSMDFAAVRGLIQLTDSGEIGVYSQPPIPINTMGNVFIQTAGEELSVILMLTNGSYWVQTDSSNNPSTFAGLIDRWYAYLLPH